MPRRPPRPPLLAVLSCVGIAALLLCTSSVWRRMGLLPDARSGLHGLGTSRLWHLGTALDGVSTKKQHCGDEPSAEPAQARPGDAYADAGASGQRSSAAGPRRQTYHVVMTSDGAVYNQWQSRVCYWHIQKLKAADPSGAMGGFTRLLHSGQPDGLMDEMPTVVVQPLRSELAKSYPVLHRPWALVQWLRHAAKLPEDYVLMVEPDHFFLNVPPLRATPERPAAFPFEYMRPQAFADVIAPYNAP